MFNLFKKTEETKEVNNSSYPLVVQQIHHEFENAADELLKSAKEVIAEASTKDAVKVSRLESLGFKQAAQVQEIKPLLEKAILSKEQIETLHYFQRNYPLNKFITEDQVKTICHKYNLVCGDVNRFKGFVPEKNLKEIEKFKLKDKDSIKYMTRYSSFDELNTPYLIPLSEHQKNFLENNERMVINEWWVEKVNTTLKICAPVKDMDISGLELVKGYKLEKKHIPDPVVLQPVRGGYLILTAWGDEASDPLVVNQINN